MTDPRPYRDERAAPPAAGPGRTRKEESGSLPPGSSARDPSGDDGDERGDVDRAMPYEEDASPQRMRPQPFDPDAEDATGDR